MPTVPYSPVPTVSPPTSAPDDYQHIQATPEAFGSQIGAATQKLGETAEKAGATGTDITVQQQTVMNNVAIDKAFSQHQLNVNNILYGDSNHPDVPGYYRLKGQAAVDARPETQQALEDSRTSVANGLSNQTQALGFNEASRRLNTNSMSDMNRYFEQQFDVATVNVQKQGLAIAAQAVGNGWNNDDLFRHNEADRLEKADAQSAAEGANPNTPEGAQTFAYNRMVASQVLYTARAIGMGTANPAAGLAFVQANQDKFDASMFRKLTDDFKPKVDGAADDSYVRGLLGSPGAAGGGTALHPAPAGGAKLADIHPDLTHISAPGGATLTVAKSAAPAFQGLVNDLESAGYKLDPATTGGYNPRNIAGTNTPSQHAYGTAIDVNWQRNTRGADTPSDLPPDLARRLASKWGLRWGGDFSGDQRDPMHFEVAQGGTDHPAQAGAAAPVVQQFATAVKGQEGPATSVSGAVAGLMPATFTQYAKPGENFANPTDRATVNDRVIADLAQRTGGDPARMAVGYFSGRDNIAPAGSATPYIEDKADANGKTTSSYVSDIAQRMGAQGGAPTTARAAAVAAPQYPDESALIQRTIADNPDPEVQARRVAKVTQALGTLRLATETDRSDLKNALPDLQAAALGGQDITIPEDRIHRLLPPAQAAHELEQLHVAQSAGQVFKAVQWGSPDQVNAAYADLSSGLGPISTMIRNKGVQMTPGTAEPGSDQETAESYRLRTSILSRFTEAVQRRTAALVDDPAGYTQTEPNVAAAATTLRASPNDPAAQRAYNTATLAVQSSLGVPEGSQHILTKAQAQTQAHQLMTVDPSKGDMGQALAGVAQQYGDAWPKAFGDLVTLGKLPGEYQVLAAMPDPVSRTDFQRALAATSAKGGMAKLREDVPPQTAKDIDAGIDDKLNDFRRTATIPGLSGNVALISTVRDSIKTLAYFYGMQSGDGSKALDKAADAVINSKYDFSGTMRVPKGTMAAAETVTGNTVAALKSEDLSPLAADTMGTPPVSAGGANNLRAADAAMKLTPQEKFLYQHHLDNLTSANGGAPVHNSDGSTSTLLQMSTDVDGRTYNIPTVWDGKVLSPDEAEKRAAAVGWDKWPSYANEDAAEARYGQMHQYIERDTSGSPGMTVEQRQAVTLEAAKRGDWVPNESDSGLVLVGKLRNGASVQMRRADGTRIEVPFKGMTDAAKVIPANLGQQPTDPAAMAR